MRELGVKTAKSTISAMTEPISKHEFTPPAITQQRSPWQSPVPYLFGGLAAMLGLIAFALLLLACSYWKLSGRLDDGNRGGEEERDIENGVEKQSDSSEVVMKKVYEEKLLVIMAGQEKPTFLATPVSTKGFFNGRNETTERNEGDKVENAKEVTEETAGHVHEEETDCANR